MTYVEFMELPSNERAKLKFYEFWAKLGRGFCNFFISIGRFFLRLGLNIRKSFKELGYAFSRGDMWTRLSFLFLGVSHIRRKQILKGICYLLLEALFILYIVVLGVNAVKGLITLGSTEIHYYCSLDGSTIATGYEGFVFSDQASAMAFCQFYNAGDGVPGDISVKYGDNSSVLLLFGILAVILIIAFIAFYSHVVKDSIEVQEKKEAHLYINTAFDDFRELLDKKFYLTLLFFPVLGVCIFTILPLIDMILMAFTNYNQSHQYPASLFDWIGLTNFNNLFGGGGSSGSIFSYTFFHILGWTLIWAFFATFLNYFLGMLLAMLINKKGIKLKKLWRTLFVFSIAVPQFVSLLTWNKFLSSSGFVEIILKTWGWMAQGDKLTVLDYTSSARIAIILINLWIGVPYTILSTSGILMNIPADLYESAQIDGAKPATIYLKITLPYILFVTGPYLITQFVGNINNFNVIYFLTAGAPTTNNYMNAGTTDLLVTWLYKLTVNSANYSYAAVIGIMTFVICAFFSLIAYKNSSAMKNEEDFA